MFGPSKREEKMRRIEIIDDIWLKIKIKQLLAQIT